MQPDLFTVQPRFDSGVALTASDHTRLGKQIQRVFDVLSDGQWHTVPEVARRTGDPENSVAAQCRNLRKPKHGGHTIERRRTGNYYEFRLKVSHGW